MAEPERLPDRVERAIRDESHEVAFSVISAWEITIKTSIGKLEGVPIDTLSEEVAAQGWHELPLRIRHLPILMQLPFHHHDPFDRALVAQSIAEKLVIFSVDAKIAKYNVDVVW